MKTFILFFLFNFSVVFGQQYIELNFTEQHNKNLNENYVFSNINTNKIDTIYVNGREDLSMYNIYSIKIDSVNNLRNTVYNIGVFEFEYLKEEIKIFDLSLIQINSISDTFSLNCIFKKNTYYLFHIFSFGNKVDITKKILFIYKN